MSYEAYVDQRPILVWKRPFGIHQAIFNTTLSPSWFGEPLLFLYPPQKTDVSVKLAPNIRPSKTIPEYGTGWQVTAFPDGTLYHSPSQRTYSSLYWEGSSFFPAKPFSTAVVRVAYIPSYLQTSLGQLGLNEREQKDFVDYWTPRMKTSPYYLISLFTTQELNRLLPLSIHPPPDTLIRVIMEYKAVPEQITLTSTSQNHDQPVVRTGFTVVELGAIGKE